MSSFAVSQCIKTMRYSYPLPLMLSVVASLTNQVTPVGSFLLSPIINVHILLFCCCFHTVISTTVLLTISSLAGSLLFQRKHLLATENNKTH